MDAITTAIGYKMVISGQETFYLGSIYVLDFPRDNTHVVRCRQLFREEHKTVVRGNHDSDCVPVTDQSDSLEGGLVAYE